MIETKFKNSEVGLIPEDWKAVPLSAIGEVKMCKRILKEQTDITGDVPFYKIGTFGKEADAYIPRELYEQFKGMYPYPKKGAILISAAGTIGRTVVFDGEDAYFQDSNIVWIDHKEKDVVNPYLEHYFKIISWKSENGGTISRLYNDNLKSTFLCYPEDKIEQSRIATALSDIDDLIATAKKLTEKKRNIKEGVMQELLSGKRRLPGFTGKWREYKLGDVLSYEQPSKYLVSSTEYAEAGIPVLTAGKTFVLGYTFEDYGIYDNLPVIIFDDFVTESKYVDFPFKAKSSAMKMLRLRNEENILKVVFEIMQRIKFPMTEHKRYWISDYSKIKIQLPSPEEQKAILKVIDGFDDEILVLENSLTKYQSLKQGMMQQLLTGKIRLI